MQNLYCKKSKSNSHSFKIHILINPIETENWFNSTRAAYFRDVCQAGAQWELAVNWTTNHYSAIEDTHYELCIIHYALCIAHYALCVTHYIYNVLRIMH